MAKVIKEAFPTEVIETYYNSSKNSSAPTGKLYTQYNNYKTKLNFVGINLRRPRAIPRELTNNDRGVVEENPVILDALEIVKSNDWENTANFFDNWNLSFNQRQALLSSTISTNEYLTSFPYLLQNEIGFELVRSNF